MTPKGIKQKRRYRVYSDFYYSIYKPYHPYSNKFGRILEHRYIYHIYLSIKYNRVIYLPTKYDIHHKNKNGRDNRIENLELLNRKEYKLKDSEAVDILCNICDDEDRKAYKDINGHLCRTCYIMVRYYQKKFGLL